MKLLLVDDDVELGNLLCEYISAEGFAASRVLTGKEGVESALSGN